MPAGPASRPWRRFLRFSVRGLIVLVLVMGAGFGWIVRSARIQREAVAAIRRGGGTVSYEWEQKGGLLLQNGSPAAPKWLVDALGVDYFGHIVVASDVNLSVAEMAHIGRLSALQSLTFALPALRSSPVGSALTDRSPVHEVTDAGLADLEGLTSLTFLDLDHARVTDAGLVHLEGLTKLELLGLTATLITDGGLVHLNGLTNLEWLFLRETRIADGGLGNLKGLTNLEWLDVSRTLVTDAGMPHLKGLTKLHFLGLMDTQVTDVGLVHLKGLTNLSELRLGGTQVSDAGLTHLKGLSSLLTLDLGETRVSDAGAKVLEQALPSLRITR